MTWVKICGTTNLEDALTAVDAGADALGFVFYPNSPRRIDAATTRQIVAELPSRIERVGVFVDESAETILETVQASGLSAAQLHGKASRQADFIQALRTRSELKIFLVLPGDETGAHSGWFDKGNVAVDAVFYDSGTAQQPGGTGKTFDWKAAASRIEAISNQVKVVVAGGLNASNVGDAISTLNPWGVDVVSGVEAAPGKKDPGKVRDFIDAVRRQEKKN
jgi:phosphoribosylanthranilate isomerase